MSPEKTESRSAIVFLLMLVLAIVMPQPVMAQCQISGTSVVLPTDNPEMGLWKYCIDVTWNSGSHGLSHLDVVLGLAECTWICDGFCFGVHNPAGSSTSPEEDVLPEMMDGVDPPRGDSESDACVVYYVAEFLCGGDPSVPGVAEPLVKYEPIDGECEPGKLGVGTYCFYTDWPPAQVYVPNSMLIVKAGQTVCFGELTGYLPTCSFPSTTESESWGMLRYRFR
ncbi:MAG: hypothetical protein KAW17_08855 [Candidatus Eisenbacteria sp.]|nr:hypothetical protein [Candidatus Eisenbacteria bacterium]